MLFVVKFIEAMVVFIDANPIVIGYVLAIVEILKRWSAGWTWMKPEYMTIVGFLIGFLFAIPAEGFVGIVWFDFVAHGFGLGLIATGLYKVGSTLAKLARGK